MHQDILRPVVGAAAIAVIAVAGLVAVRHTTSTPAAASGPADIAVRCEPSQRAMIRQPTADTAGQVVVECVTDAGAAAAQAALVDAQRAAGVPTSAVPVTMRQAAYAPAPAQPVVYAPAAVAPATVAAAPARTTVARQEGRSWQKRALVIGGAAGAGAGVGALAGGKKGALIGAAIGGGGAALFEALKKR